MKDGEEYDGRGERYKCGRKVIIEVGGLEEQIIADWMEQGLGFRNTLNMVNQSRIDRGLIHVGISCIIGVF